MFFDGSARERRPVSLSGRKKAHSSSQETAAKSAQDRAARELLQRKQTAAVRIQSEWRRVLARRSLEVSQRAAFDASLLALKQSQQSAGSTQPGLVADVTVEMVLLMSRRLAVFYYPDIVIDKDARRLRASSVAVREDRLRLKALMGLWMQLVRRPEAMQRYIAMWGEVSSIGIASNETIKRPSRPVEVFTMAFPMRALFAMLIRTAQSSMISLAESLPGSAPVDVRTEVLLPMQVIQVLVNTAKACTGLPLSLFATMNGVNRAVLQLFSAGINAANIDESVRTAVGNFVGYYLNQTIELGNQLSQGRKTLCEALLPWICLPHWNSPYAASMATPLKSLPYDLWTGIFASRLSEEVVFGTKTKDASGCAVKTTSREDICNPCDGPSLLIPSFCFRESKDDATLLSEHLKTVCFLQNASAFFLHSSSIGVSSGSASAPDRAVFGAWLALFDSILNVLSEDSCDVPIRTALYHLDVIDPSLGPKRLTRIDLAAVADDTDGIMRPRVVVVAEDDPLLPVYMESSLATASAGTAMELASGESEGLEAEVQSVSTSSVSRVERSPSYASLGGLRAEIAVYPLFIHAMTGRDLQVWNDTMALNPAICSMLIEIVKFALGPRALTELLKDSNDLMGDVELRIISVYAKLIGFGGSAFPGRPASRPPTGFDSVSHGATFPMEYNKLVCSIMNSIGFDSRKPPMIRRLWSAFINGCPNIERPLGVEDNTFATLFRRAFDYSPLIYAGNKIVDARSLQLDELVDSVPNCGPMSFYYILCISLSHQLTTIDDEAFYDGISSLNAISGEVAQLLLLLKNVLYHLYWTKPLMLLPFENNVSVSIQNGDAFGVLLRDRVGAINVLQACSRLYNQLAVRNERRAHFVANALHTSIFRLTDHAKRQSGVISTEDFIWTGPRHSTLASQDPSIVASRYGGDRSSSSGGPASFARTGIDTATAMSSEVTQAVWDLGTNSKFKFVDARFQVVLVNIPEIIRFEQRTSILLNLIQADNNENENIYMSLRIVRIRRGSVLQDAFNALGSASGAQLRHRFRVYFVSAAGHDEAGIDGGGLYKEFLECFMQEAFNPEAGYFDTTESMELIPSSRKTGSLEFYNFIGKMLAKAVYSGILLEPQFSPVFLNLLLGRSNQIDDMSYLDDQFYKSMMRIKRMVWNGEDVAELGLHFQTLEGEDIVPNGHNIPVTNSNGIEYLLRLSKYKLNTSYKAASEAFLSGFREVVPLLWIRMFNAREMQSVLGGELRPLNLIDLKNNVNYAGGYHESQPYIHMLWEVVEEFSAEEQGDFLKFITSCSRQPLLGFATLSPKIGIQQVPMRYPDDPPTNSPRLPTASTCFNLLKLPVYESKEMLREKLKYAISSHAGFELS